MDSRQKKFHIHTLSLGMPFYFAKMYFYPTINFMDQQKTPFLWNLFQIVSKYVFESLNSVSMGKKYNYSDCQEIQCDKRYFGKIYAKKYFGL